ncbi:MAG TPA: hypothetical protein VH062_07350 [Polyangiaceae bacterium]|nr:hypothetical protein [Polyangiaceae bacterium]
MRGFALSAAVVAAACGGIVTDSRGDGGNGATGNGATGNGATGATTGLGARTGSGGTTGKGGGAGKAGGVAKGGTTGGAGVPGTGAGPVAGPCGDGVVEVFEECDPAVLVNLTCADLTMGAFPAGTVGCNKSCQYDTSGCYSAGSGGSVGTGGFTGVGAMGNDPFSRCESTPSIFANDCTETCGCKVCPDVYAACRADGGCAWILACAQQSGCASVDQCYQTQCSTIIDRAGGRSSPGAKYADAALSCLAQFGCGVACN